MNAHPNSPRDAFTAWMASERSLPIAEVRERDARISETRNPFDANRDRHAVSLGATIYAAQCARCHGENADGRGPDVLPTAPCKDFHAPPTRLAVWLHRGAPRSWFRKIRDGSGPLVSYPDGERTAMPAFRSSLSNEQIWLVVTYLQSLDVYIDPVSGGEIRHP
ncbi:MAG: cytochrome c [Phycisphaerae bacterium]